ncbi:MAG: glycosyltransferase [Pseudomonas sp.]|uniref:glycosyltransferase n=1 Tax=Pseudomonas sp. TaxID=306 RepID=UPI003D0AEB07
MARRVFILVPSFDPTGPVKGACALANILVARFPVTLVALKDPPHSQAMPAVDEGVNCLSLAGVTGWRSKLAAYKELLREARAAGARPASISLCFSADVINAFCASEAAIATSVRSNLFQDYRMGFGLPGVPLAFLHFLLLNRFSRVVAMTGSMAAQIGRFVRRAPVVIGNFVDEDFLEPYRAEVPTGPYRFLFLGSLTVRKQPLLLVEAMAQLLERGVEARLDMVGGGPLAEEVRARVEQLGLGQQVILHGHLSDPYPLLAAADVMVLPSLSEGLSRAGLEALYLGVPCVLRDVDGNGELISEGVNGALFREDVGLLDSMLVAARLRQLSGMRASLLPEVFRQAYAERCFLGLIESLES